MFSLIKKDFLVVWIVLSGMVIMIPCITALAVIAMVEDFGGIIAGIFFLIIIIICFLSTFISLGMDSSTNVEMMYASLPIKRSAIVKARYVSAAMFILINFSLVVLTILITKQIFQITDPLFKIFLTAPGILSMVLLLLLLLSLLLPFYFKYGPGKGVTVAVFSQIGLVLIVPVIKCIVNLFGGILNFDIGYIVRMLQSFLTWIFGLKPLFAYSFVIGTMVIIILLSTVFSVRFYKKRDL